MFRITFFILIAVTMLSGCLQTKKKYNLKKVEVTKSVTVPDDGGTPIAGLAESPKANRVVTFSDFGEEVHVKHGETVNFIYEGNIFDESYIMYESTDDGYILRLAQLNAPVDIEFTRLCQTYIVASPEATNIKVSDPVRYEQIVWTPRADGSWEVRIGTTGRGCSSPALDHLYKLRDKSYEKAVKKTKMK